MIFVFYAQFLGVAISAPQETFGFLCRRLPDRRAYQKCSRLPVEFLIEDRSTSHGTQLHRGNQRRGSNLKPRTPKPKAFGTKPKAYTSRPKPKAKNRSPKPKALHFNSKIAIPPFFERNLTLGIQRDLVDVIGGDVVH